jgi:NADH:ubiquinone reductase (H+-translocating)
LKKLVIIGGGFGGVSTAQALSKIPNLEITLIDRRNFHLFQPLLYQVAMAGLNPSDIAVPLRSLFRSHKNLRVILGEVDTLDFEHRRVGYGGQWAPYDYLVLSCGAKHSYFGNDQWEEIAPGLKNVEQALEIRRRVLLAFEQAEKAEDERELERLLTFVIVGGGPTGVELAGGIAELAAHTLSRDFRKADLRKTKVILVEAGSRLLAAFPERLSSSAKNSLESLGVEVVLNCRASNLSREGLSLGERRVPAKTILWAAGVFPASITALIPGPRDSVGRIVVNPDLSLMDRPEVFVIGDQAAFVDPSGKTLPGIAPVAIQQGAFVGEAIKADQGGRPRPSFRYLDKGIMATIGRRRAVAKAGSLELEGLLAWLLWVFIHVLYLARFRNRVFVLAQWAWSYFAFGRGARLITHKTWRFYSGEKIDLE